MAPTAEVVRDLLGSAREDILQGNLLAASALALASMPFWLWQLISLGEYSQATFAVVAVLAVLTVTVLPRRIPYLVRTSILLGVWTSSAVVVLATGGNRPIGTAMAVAVLVMAVLLHEVRGAATWIAIIVSSMVLLAIGDAYGVLPQIDYEIGPVEQWIQLLVGTVPIIGPLVVSTVVLVRRLNSAAVAATAEAEARQEALDALSDAQDRLAHSVRMEALGQVAGGVAHDLNNGLTVILAGADLAREMTDDDLVREVVEDVMKAAQRAATLTAQLLSLSRRDVARPRPLNLHRSLEEVAHVLGRTLPATIQVSLSLQARDAVIDADPTLLQQAVLNLGINARDAMPDGGSIRVATMDGTDDLVLIEIVDDGEGMDDATRARALEPFFTTKSSGRGTGLGLANVADFAERMGGLLEIESQLGQGTCVRLSLPRSTATLEEPSVSDDGPSRGGGERILVAEDDIQVRAVICGALADAGYQVVEARDGGEALTILGEMRPALLVTDVVMPGVGGARLLTEARELHAGLPVVVCSGYAPDDALRESIAAGDVPFLAKPFRRAQLVSTVREVLEAVG